MWNPGKTDWFGVNTWFDICNVCCVNPIKHAREILSRKGFIWLELTFMLSVRMTAFY